MKIVGIIAEYNPFHKGHAYHIEEAKKAAGADFAVVVMGGDYMQRGTPAITDMYTRCEMALQSGADMVFLLPLAYATGSAEIFAKGAVSVLTGLSFVDALSFGCETADLSLLTDAAKLLANMPPEMEERTALLVKKGMTYPLARMTAVLEGSDSFSEEFLSSPGNILGIEYIKAIQELKSPLKVFPISRVGDGYHEQISTETVFASATGLRNAYRETGSLEALKDGIPSVAFQLLEQQEQHTFPVWEDDFSELLYYALHFSHRDISAQNDDASKHQDISRQNSNTVQQHSLTVHPDISPDLADRIMRFSDDYISFEELAKQIKSKQYTLTRIRRCLLHILLDIRKEDLVFPAPFTLLLGFRKEASFLLRGQGTIPVITKAADYRELIPSKKGQQLFEKEQKAAALYHHILFTKYQQKEPNLFQRSPIII